MQHKIKILIIVSVLGLLSLSLIQGYLINNTYKLKKKAFITDTKKAIYDLDDLSPSLDSINTIWQEKLLTLIENHKIKKVSKEEVVSSLKKIVDSLNTSYVYNLKKEIAKKNIGYEIGFKKVIKNIILLDSIQNDTLFSATKNNTFHLLGAKFPTEKSHTLSTSNWEATHNFNKKEKTASYSYNLRLETENFMNIERWQEIVLSKMIFLLVISILVFLLVFGLLFYSIKNLISQKKIADIKTDFVNNITHELKTPLSTLSLATKMLHQHKNTTSTISIINTIERQNIRLQKLIDQVLTNSLGYQEIKLKKEIVNSSEYLNTLISDFKFSLNSEKVQITTHIDTNVSLYIDKFHITTAILNILTNAIKYGKENINIDVSVSLNDFFNIAIKDNGIGIPKKEFPFLFEKFYRVGNKEIHNVKGLGLGLYYTNQIIKAHQGEILVESKEDKETIFTIKIPFKNNN